MVGHNTNEAPFFTRPDLLSNTDLAAFIKTTYIGATQSTVDYVLNTLYPAVYDGTYPWRSPLERTFNLVSDSSFVCNTNYLNKAFNNQTYAYEFQVPPAFHGFDVPYTFYNGQGTNLSTGLIAPVAEGMQAYITNFVQTGNPNGPGVPPFPIQGKNASMNGLNVTGFTPQIDPTVNVRCTWWQKAQYY
jgi:carboxylesterase type B